MPYYPKDFREPQTDAWWDPDAVRTREADAMLTDEDRRKMLYRVMLAPFAMFAAAFAGAFGQRPLRVPRDRPDKPTRSCNACVSGKCPMSPRYDLHGQYVGGRFFELVDATPYKKVWRCSRCGNQFRTMSGDNPADFHSC